MDDMEHFIRGNLEPLYERIVKLNPARMHHDFQMWEDITEEASAGLKELFNIWQQELDNAL